MRCAATGAQYKVFGYKAKQVRDNIHSVDLVHAFDQFFRNPRSGEVYNIGGGRFSNCSMLEAIDLSEEITGRKLMWEYVPESRRGDHIWYISDMSRFKSHYPAWRIKYDVPSILREIYDTNRAGWLSGRSAARA
jgi:CDP-paratose 2-epimerase